MQPDFGLTARSVLSMKNVGTIEPTTKTWYPYLVVDITAFGDVKRATLICDSEIRHSKLGANWKQAFRNI